MQSCHCLWSESFTFFDPTPLMEALQRILPSLRSQACPTFFSFQA
jgi:hypothetical protein